MFLSQNGQLLHKEFRMYQKCLDSLSKSGQSILCIGQLVMISYITGPTVQVKQCFLVDIYGLPQLRNVTIARQSMHVKPVPPYNYWPWIAMASDLYMDNSFIFCSQTNHCKVSVLLDVPNLNILLKGFICMSFQYAGFDRITMLSSQTCG